ncbi:MAG TPA: CBS domain-containing protein [Pilimelia sp.]|nr:CBS domain-containing protein [Pilimelia sp.]
MSRWEVGDVMTADVVSVRADAPLNEVLYVLALHGVSAVPVVDAGGRVLGILTTADVLTGAQAAAATYRRRLLDARRHGYARSRPAGAVAADLLTAPVMTIPARASVASAAKLLATAGVSRLPVVDDEGRLTGIVSRPDVLKVFDSAPTQPHASIR